MTTNKKNKKNRYFICTFGNGNRALYQISDIDETGYYMEMFELTPDNFKGRRLYATAVGGSPDKYNSLPYMREVFGV